MIEDTLATMLRHSNSQRCNCIPTTPDSRSRTSGSPNANLNSTPFNRPLVLLPLSSPPLSLDNPSPQFYPPLSYAHRPHRQKPRLSLNLYARKYHASLPAMIDQHPPLGFAESDLDYFTAATLEPPTDLKTCASAPPSPSSTHSHLDATPGPPPFVTSHSHPQSQSSDSTPTSTIPVTQNQAKSESTSPTYSQSKYSSHTSESSQSQSQSRPRRPRRPRRSTAPALDHIDGLFSERIIDVDLFLS
ncbi:hypothetical protein SISSUDRAFT_1132175 [Sistotremastrum suecicum HHB10207 ss-3]|uniref:Uncharacterized protein n=1 Tax=Sistotremastrum suecicum HHB10207 ss-3 TaxID=1314776 RepID=A0A165Z7E3_9AGAM|nr:hypothetical protein SISSUDRAFT_1132175 [Sistotremastrum suecicum HHB10207 ss-3]